MIKADVMEVISMETVAALDARLGRLASRIAIERDEYARLVLQVRTDRLLEDRHAVGCRFCRLAALLRGARAELGTLPMPRVVPGA